MRLTPAFGAFAAGLIAAALFAPPSSMAQSLRDLSITIGPKGIEIGPQQQRGRSHRPRCLSRNDFDRVVTHQGWRGLHDWSGRGDSVRVKGRQWGGLYQLEFDECSGQMLEARRIDFDRGHWDRSSWKGDDRRRGRR